MANLRNSLIHLTNRLGIYNPLRNFYYKAQLDNRQRRAFLKQFLFEGALCFDVGANIGEMTDLYRSLGGRVIAVEPHQGCAAYLRRKYRRDGQVIVLEKAVSSREGEQEMYYCEANQLSTLSREFISAIDESRRFGQLPSFKKTMVATTTLEGMIREYGRPDFLKVDVEGGEHEVLMGLKSPVPYVCFEYTFPESRQSFEDCIKHLDGLGDALYNMTGIHDFTGFVFSEWFSSRKLSDILNTGFQNSSGNIFVKYPEA